MAINMAELYVRISRDAALIIAVVLLLQFEIEARAISRTIRNQMPEIPTKEKIHLLGERLGLAPHHWNNE